METKLETLEGVEVRALPSSVSSNSPKVSIFGSKAGFVIPKNKLSGSLVPIFRGSAKTGPADLVKEVSNQQDVRKTKWGPDPTQDNAVRKGRIVAYQTRLEQITELLKAGALEVDDDLARESASVSSDVVSQLSLNVTEKLAQLELEKREVIGEILKLNPGYKVPPDYKPVLKEDKVPIPIKAYPGYNFIVLLLGPESNALKRLEEETGVKVRVYGTKAGTGEKREITNSDVNEAQSNYEDIYVHVSAETFEKVDAAIALIELLLSPVNVNHMVTTATNHTMGDDGKVPNPSQKDSTSAYPIMSISAASQVTLPPTAMLAQSAPQQYQAYPTPWYSIGPTNVSMPTPSGFTPVHNNAVRFPVSSSNISNIHQSAGVRPSFTPGPGNFSGISIAKAQPPMQFLQRPMNLVPQYPNFPPQQRPMHQLPPNRPVSFPFAASSMSAGGMPGARPFLPHIPRAGPAFPMGMVPNQPSMTPMPTINTAWSNAPSVTLPPRPNYMQITPSPIQVQRQPSITPQALTVSQPLQNLSTFPHHRAPASGGISSVPTYSGPVPVASPAHVPTPAPGPSPVVFPAAPQVAASGSAVSPIPAQMPIPVLSSQPVVPHPLVSAPSFATGQASNPAMPPPNAQLPPPAAANSTPPVTTPKLPRPSSSDFTFQPLGSSASSSNPSSKLVGEQHPSFPPHLHVSPHSFVSPNGPQALPGPGAPQSLAPAPLPSPSFRPALQNPNPMGTMSLPRPASMMQQHAPFSAVTIPAGNVNMLRPLPRAIFPNSQNASAVGPMNPQGPLSFPPPQAHNLGLPITRPTFPIQHQNQLPHTTPQTFMMQGQQLVGNNTGFVPGRSVPIPGGSQTYDPFSPTSIPTGRPLNPNVRPNTARTENDAEYEDLMASMGVR